MRRTPGPQAGGESWPLVEVVRAGSEPKRPAVWMLCGYDDEEFSNTHYGFNLADDARAAARTR